MGGERTRRSPSVLRRCLRRQGGIASPRRALVAAGGDLSSAVKPLVNHIALSLISPSRLARSLPSRASAVSRSRTRISLDLLNTAMTALPNPSIFLHSY